jgi:predicted ATPase
LIHRADNLFIVTGGPGAGKTTLLDAAAADGFRVGQEAARAIIQSQNAIGGPAHHFGRRDLFAELMLDRDIQTYLALSGGAPALCDRAIPELVCYCRDWGVGDDAHFARAAEQYRYNPTVFLAPAWREIFVTDSERIEGWEHAQRVAESLRAGYAELGYRIVELPKVSVAERLAFVKDVIAHA